MGAKWWGGSGIDKKRITQPSYSELEADNARLRKENKRLREAVGRAALMLDDDAVKAGFGDYLRDTLVLTGRD